MLPKICISTKFPFFPTNCLGGKKKKNWRWEQKIGRKTKSWTEPKRVTLPRIFGLRCRFDSNYAVLPLGGGRKRVRNKWNTETKPYNFNENLFFFFSFSHLAFPPPPPFFWSSTLFIIRERKGWGVWRLIAERLNFREFWWSEYWRFIWKKIRE